MASGLPSTLSWNDSSVIKPPLIPETLLKATDRILAHERRTGKLPNSYHRRQVWAAEICEQRQTPAAGLCCRLGWHPAVSWGGCLKLTSPLGAAVTEGAQPAESDSSQ